MKNTTLTFKEAKQKGEKLSMVTAYDYTVAKLVEKSGINAILVGDSLGMTMLGYEDTISVTLEDMIHHSRAVSRGVKDTLVVCDMPFMSYTNTNIPQAVENAGRLMSEGRANCVKLEGGTEVKEIIKAIVDAKIPVCAHIGLTPQSLNQLGGFKVQGKNLDTAKNLLADAKAVEGAGAFAVVLECVPKELADKITEMLEIPTIGIGAGNGCDGQVLVYQDMLGMYDDFKPKFIKHFAQIGDEVVEAFKNYDKEVKEKTFPTEEHSFKMKKELLDQIL
ncbi:3-methyl-2-oxobutanoate hydroxymethyltransferase [Peptoniphilus olsenii]|uniref:3-methyl-2-oxobutanoate hydroxymethyltransferase n=1 Tax=Peptoniphilus olsenii TaxID=411570 RepID=A0ABV2JBE4_9FIRM